MANTQQTSRKIAEREVIKMNVQLNKSELKSLKDKGIEILSDKDYSEDEIFELLDKLREIEVFYAQGSSENELKMANKYAHIADKIQSAIPDF